jgi:hypothetical protein
VLTSNNGRWEAIVPVGENITITYALSCAQTESQSVNVTDTKFDVGTHVTSSANYVPYQISGQIRDCNGSLIEEGFLKIRSKRINKTLYIDSSTFNLSFPLCEGDLVDLSCTTVTADYETTILENVPYNIDLSSIYLCNDIKDNYLILNIDGFVRKYTSFEKTINNEIIQIGASSFSLPVFLKFGHANMVGMLDNKKANIVWVDDQIAGYGVSLSCPTSSECGFTNAEIIYWGQNGNLVKGRFEGRFWLKTLNPIGAQYKNISGEFQIKQ